MTKNLQQHLLVDGYNVAHAWPQMKQVLIKYGSQAVTVRLCEEVRVIHDYDGLRTTIVFDGKGDDLQIEQPSKDPTLSLLFSPKGITADSLIEKFVNRSKRPQDLIIATQDNALALTVTSYGAQVISPFFLQEWIDRVAKRQTTFLSKNQKISKQRWGNYFEDKL